MLFKGFSFAPIQASAVFVLRDQCHLVQEEEEAAKAESEETTVDANGDKVTAAKHIIE